LGFEVPTIDLGEDLQTITAHIEVKELEKVNKRLKEYKEKEFEEKILINFDTEEGKLYWINENGKKFVCHLKVDSLPYKIIYFLAKEKNFVTTEELAEEYDKDKALIRSVISKLRKKLKQKLKIDGKKIIESIPSQGYRIRNVKIVEKPI
jgi:predicted HTH transcriptional regulator